MVGHAHWRVLHLRVYSNRKEQGVFFYLEAFSCIRLDTIVTFVNQMDLTPQALLQERQL